MELYKEHNSFEKRQQECLRILNKYPDRIPIIVCKSSDCKLPDIDKQKYLVPNDMNMGQFIYVIRRRIHLEAAEALFILVNKSLQPGNKPIKEVYETHKDEDKFLYITYSSENTFG